VKHKICGFDGNNFQVAHNNSKVGRNKIKGQYNKIKIWRNKIKTPFSSANPEFSRTCSQFCPPRRFESIRTGTRSAGVSPTAPRVRARRFLVDESSIAYLSVKRKKNSPPIARGPHGRPSTVSPTDRSL
jgi:hypothetical protein